LQQHISFRPKDSRLEKRLLIGKSSIIGKMMTSSKETGPTLDGSPPLDDETSQEQFEHVSKLEAESKHPENEKTVNTRTFMAFVAMAFLWTGSQIPLFLFGGIPPYIYQDLGGVDHWTWFGIGNLLALAATCPFVGALSDLIGRRYVALLGAGFLILGMIVVSTAHTMNTFICGMVLSGIGAGINELTALAATSEMAPTSKRGKYVAILIFTIIPFCPSVLWAQLIAYHCGWRWIGLLCGLCVVTLVTLVTCK
jgi:MFS family permease